jgi:hypothetical protein
VAFYSKLSSAQFRGFKVCSKAQEYVSCSFDIDARARGFKKRVPRKRDNYPSLFMRYLNLSGANLRRKQRYSPAHGGSHKPAPFHRRQGHYCIAKVCGAAGGKGKSSGHGANTGLTH